MLPLHNRAALVTGAGAGLGRAHALALARAGADVVVNDVPAANEAVERTLSDIEALGGRGHSVLVDVTASSASPLLVETASATFGRLDVVVANAGVLRSELFPDVSDDNWKLHQRVHLDASFTLARAAWPHLASSDAGRLVLTTSAGGLFGARGLTSYGAAKMGVAGLLRVLAVEAGDTNIRVNAIAPLAWTPMSQAGGRTGSAAQILGPDRFASFSPDHVAEVVVALSHPDSRAHGQIISVGGERVAEVVVAETVGVVGRTLTWQDVLASWDVITDRSDLRVPTTMNDALEQYAEGRDRVGNGHGDDPR